MKIHNKVSLSFVSIVLGLILPVVVLAAGPENVNLKSAANFAILGQTAVTTTGTTSVVGDIGISPAAASYITGFALNLPASGTYATSSLVTGKIYAPGYADPTSSYMTVAINDMQNAYNDAAAKTNPTAVELGAGNIGGLTLAPGLYKWSTGVTVPTSVTLSGGANDIWIFQIAQNLTVSSYAKIILSGGAQASNIYWQVAGQATLGTASIFNGNILSQTAIVLNTNATLYGRALAQTAVTLDSNAVVIPTTSALAPTPAPVPAPVPVSNDGLGQNAYVAPTTNTTSATAPVATSAVVKYDFGTTTLKNGSRGVAAKELQRYLNDKLNLGLKLDGVIGPKTIAVIKKWQKEHGLVVDGLIGPKTKTLMNSGQ